MVELLKWLLNDLIPHKFLIYGIIPIDVENESKRQENLKKREDIK
jgi:hypothetical protein